MKSWWWFHSSLRIVGKPVKGIHVTERERERVVRLPGDFCNFMFYSYTQNFFLKMLQKTWLCCFFTVVLSGQPQDLSFAGCSDDTSSAWILNSTAMRVLYFVWKFYLRGLQGISHGLLAVPVSAVSGSLVDGLFRFFLFSLSGHQASELVTQQSVPGLWQVAFWFARPKRTDWERTEIFLL